FTPWGTNCLCASDRRSFIDNLLDWVERTISEDKRKLARIHSVLCPDCLNRLTAELGLMQPDQMLALPQFNSASQGESGMMEQERRTTSPEAERAVIKNGLRFLKHEAARRRRMEADGIKQLVISVDDVELKPMDLRQCDGLQFVVNAPDGAHLLKFMTEDEEGPLLLATLWLHRAEIDCASARLL